jgi:hypothetical protein
MKNMIAILFVLVTIGLMAPATLADYSERQKITSIPRGVWAQHGNAVAVSGNTMVVGAQHDATSASQAGSAFIYVFDGSTWIQQAQFLASDAAVADKFGYSVAIEGDTVVVGAFNDDSPLSNAGSVYVFVRNGTTWSFQQKLTAPDATVDDWFGSSVAVFGATIAVGANHAEAQEAGAVYIFFRGGTVWTPGPKLVPVAPVILGDHFGDSLAFDGTRLVVGASGDDTPQTSAGAVYVYTAGNVQFFFEQKLTIFDGTNGDLFGFSVAIDGTTIVAGARDDSTVVGQTAIGAAYIWTFNGSTWSPQQKLLASDGAAFDRFGYSVAVHGDTVAVGAREDDNAAGPDTGSEYIFTRTGSVWTQRQKILPTDTFNGDRFGISTAFTAAGNLVIGAAEKQLTNPNGQGAVYYFTLPPPITLFDYDGDSRADISVYRPSSGVWYLNRSTAGFTAVQFGVSTDRIVPADFDGDRKTDIAVYRPAAGAWYILNSSTGTFIAVAFGAPEDLPTPADYDGAGRADISVYRPSGGVWYRLNSSNGSFYAVQFGVSDDKPTIGDFDGDARADIGVYRPSSGVWYRLNSSTGTLVAVAFGVSTDLLTPADFDGDARTDVAVYRPSSGVWYILNSSTGTLSAVQFGASGDQPAAGDFDGDGRADVTVFRGSSGTWYYLQSSNGTFLAIQFGLNSDKPTPSAFRY